MHKSKIPHLYILFSFTRLTPIESAARESFFVLGSMLSSLVYDSIDGLD
ncbi:MAG: hypothetical protein ACLUOG_06600 [Peptoniphilus lacrimalis]